MAMNSNKNLNEYKYKVMTVCKDKGWDHCSLEKVWLLLTEEIGELAGSIRRHSNTFRDKRRIKIEDELGDVFSYLFQLSGMLNIDLDQMWEKNITKSYNKKYKDSNSQYKDNSNCYYYNDEYRRQKYFRSNSNRTTV